MAEILRVKFETVAESGGAGVDSILLAVNNVAHQIQRQPVVISIPSTDRDGAGNPVAVSLDFGMMNEHITLSGVCPDLPSGADLPYPSKRTVQDMVRTGWKTVRVDTSGGDISVTGGWRLYMDEGEGHGELLYKVIPQGLMFTRDGGGTHWEFKLTLQVVDWPPAPTSF